MNKAAILLNYMASTATINRPAYKERFNELLSEARDLIENMHDYRGAGEIRFKAAMYAKENGGSESDIKSAAQSAMGAYLNSASNMKKQSNKSAAEADQSRAIQIAEIFGLEKPE
jgi:hypothetical protein